MKLISWNLLHRNGAESDEVARLIEQHRPDLLLMQEVTTSFESLTRKVGGVLDRTPLPGRVHGLACWTPRPLPRPTLVFPLPSGPVVLRVWQLVQMDGMAVANVHLSQGQLLNRLQLRAIARVLPHAAAVIGDFNLVGPPLLPGFRDVGQRRYTHRMSDVLPLRLDRCLIRGMVCTEASVLSRGASDHHPIMLRLAPASLAPGSMAPGSEVRQQEPRARVA